MLKPVLNIVPPFHFRYYIRQKLIPTTVNENIPLRKELYSYFIKEVDLVFDVSQFLRKYATIYVEGFRNNN